MPRFQSVPMMFDRDGLLPCPPPMRFLPPIWLLVSLGLSADQGKLNLSSANVIVPPSSPDVEGGSVCLHLTLRPFIPVMKTQVPSHGDVNEKCWFRMLALVFNRRPCLSFDKAS